MRDSFANCKARADTCRAPARRAAASAGRVAAQLARFLALERHRSGPAVGRTATSRANSRASRREPLALLDLVARLLRHQIGEADQLLSNLEELERGFGLMRRILFEMADDEPRRLSTLVNRSAEFACLIAGDGVVTFANEALQQRLGGAAIGKSILDWHTRETGEVLQVGFDQAVATGSWRGEGQVIEDAAGETLDVEITLTVVQGERNGDVCIAVCERDS